MTTPPTRPPRRTLSYRSALRVGRTLHPGTAGTKRLTAEYGERLLCVRYRYDVDHAVCLTTAEVVVAERPWRPAIPPRTVVGVRVEWGDFSSRQRLRAEKGRWDPNRGLWFLEWRAVRKLGLQGNVAIDTLPDPLRRRLSEPALRSLGLRPTRKALTAAPDEGPG